MIVLIHILIALSSVVFTTYAFFAPSRTKLRASYGLVALVLASGTYLVWTNPAHMVQACTSGLIYVGGVTVGILAVHRKLAYANVEAE
jgi:hypothetical protein